MLLESIPMPVPVRLERQVVRCRHLLIASALSFTGFAPTQATAQSFDCTKARPPIETSICASPRLSDLDQRLAAAYSKLTAQLASDAGSLQQARTAQRDWVAARNRTCGGVPAARIESCLAETYETRLAALAATAAVAEQVPDDPAVPEASLTRKAVPATGQGEALVQVKSPGRFSISVKSSTGVALQLVDMIAGPGEISGDAGSRDGRLDVLLDTGVYKLRSFGAKDAKGEAELTIAPFRPAAAASRDLLRGGEMAGDLADIQQRSFWVIVDKSQRLSVEAVGRAVQDLRAWRNGIELSELKPGIATIETRPGLPSTRLRLEGTVEAGLYLVTAYGGAPLPWTNGDAATPFVLRSGPLPVVAGGWTEGTIGPFGSVRLQIPAPAT